MYKVFIKLDKNQYIIDVASNAFYSEQELLNKEYIKIDQGANGYIYGHAQPNYLQAKYGKPTFSDFGIPNFKYIDNTIIELTEDEKRAITFYNNATEQDMINADLYIQIATIQAQTGAPITLSLQSPRYEQIKKYYKLNLYSDIELDLFITVNWISEEEKVAIKEA